MLAKSYDKLGDYSAANLVIDDFIDKYPESNYLDDIYFLKGNIYYKQKSYVEAIEEWLWVVYNGNDSRLKNKTGDYIVRTMELYLTDNEITKLRRNYPDNTFDAIFMAYGIRNMPDYRSCLLNLNRMLRPGGVIAFHEYSLSDNPFARWYWRIMGYGLIIPLSTLLTGSSRIFRYLTKSVLDFLSPEEFITLLKETGFKDVHSEPLPSWRRPILRTFLACKP